MNHCFKKISVFFFALITGQACVSPYDIRYNLAADLLTVEGFVSDATGTTVSIRLSRSEQVSVYNEPIKGCVVEILEGSGTKIALKETQPGFYSTPDGFKGVAGQTYQLRFTTPQGKTYESGVEKMAVAPPIKKIYQSFNAKGQLDRTGEKLLFSTFDIFVDLDDPASEKNSYLWQWQLFEKQEACITCKEGYLDSKTLKCVGASTRFTIYPTFDYRCKGNCWDLFYSTDINILSDVYSNGRTISARRVAQVPFYSEGGALIEVQQYAISNAAYQYYSLLRDQTQTTGTLADTPPAPLIGNIKNVADRSEIVVGYFGAAGVQKARYWVERQGFSDKGTRTYLLGRDYNFEPESPPRPPTFEIRPPMFPCVTTRNRSSLLPAGWRF